MGNWSRRGSRNAESYLLRFWQEPRESGRPAEFRGYVRNLRTGEERLLGDLDALVDLIQHQLQAASGEQGLELESGEAVES